SKTGANGRACFTGWSAAARSGPKRKSIRWRFTWQPGSGRRVKRQRRNSDTGFPVYDGLRAEHLPRRTRRARRVKRAIIVNLVFLRVLRDLRGKKKCKVVASESFRRLRAGAKRRLR